ncbi:hypothetical protein DFJ73DRAFT_872814 [Zopfochytrium polystomum]|nr:hypothetical protein DFJ73DRAFT_872814 [Zopfochytrium polystomum]
MMSPTPEPAIIAWLMSHDVSIRWQTLRDLLHSPGWEAERAKVAESGFGARLLGCQDSDGLWAGGFFVPAGFSGADWKAEGQPWTATHFSLSLLRELGLDPECPAAKRTVECLSKHSMRWDPGHKPFWMGETDVCINARVLLDSMYFGKIDTVPDLLQVIMNDFLPLDGGWNCYTEWSGSKRASFDSTLSVLEALLEAERLGFATKESVSARLMGQEFLLKRNLFRRLSDPERKPANPDFLLLTYPRRPKYDILRALEYFQKESLQNKSVPDARLTEAIEILRSKKQSDGKWLLERVSRGREWFPLTEGVGQPSAALTLRALYVLQWWDGFHRSDSIAPDT